MSDPKEYQIDEIKCPHCGYIDADLAMDNYEMVSYWGENKTIIFCNKCDKEFAIFEIVRRTYKIREIND